MNSPDADPVENFSASAKRVGSVSSRACLDAQTWYKFKSCFGVSIRCFVVSWFRAPCSHTFFPRFELDQCICLAL